ncbi:PulJ/GspJ family protein [Paraburkholderia rhizosphaerae]|uniref:General secretion pathway protein J n=1 Tax=Paraburkholderia rhizosphaerae TaxID=480658 RepID=A0A4R8LVA2_9BURK|nr:prepilin-type N-terminal cleavage/methylation domain-containing protein [Paraburkholderia rhizosphaerae]TDY51733.1 general secretion pathway protein J [Paraburkholderia rhizosphaerae]
MNPAVLCKRGAKRDVVRDAQRRTQRRRTAHGFTLIELLVAIAILAVIAVLSWRGLDEIIRSRQIITNAMEDERVFAQLFDQMRIDARQAASEDEVGQPSVSVATSGLQIVRELYTPGAAPRLQVVRYRVSEGHVTRYASPPLRNLGEVRRALSGDENSNWSAVPLMSGVGMITARVFVPKVGWTTQMKDVQSAMSDSLNNLKVPQLGNAPIPRAVTGLEVSIGAASLKRPVTRVFLVGE